jgi:prepilin-type N-terminal cleavage/methylation domain-containing protein
MTSRLIHKIREQQGLTLIELSVVMLILGVVTAIFLSALVVVQNNVVIQQRRTQNNDQVRAALFSIDRQVRSAGYIYDPTTEVVPNYNLTVYTQANAPTSTPPDRCIEWRIDTNKQLLRRWWDPANPGAARAFAPVAENIVNRVGSTPAFTLATSGPTSLVNIVLLANVKGTADTYETVRVTSTITARNSAPSTSCTPRPVG